MKKSYLPIQQKLMRIVLVVSSVVLFLTCLAFFTYEFITFRENARRQLTTLGEIISANSTAALAFESREDADEILAALKAEKHILAACLYDKKGKLFSKYPATINDRYLPSSPQPDGLKYVNSMLEGFQTIREGDNMVGTLYLQSDLKALYGTFTRYAIIASLVFAIAILIAYFLSKRLQRTISEPILALAETAGNISNKHDYSVRAQKFHEDELGSLTDAFNKMLDQIERQNLAITSFNSALEMNVTERTKELEQANAELKLKSEFVEAIIDSSVDVIAVFDLQLNYVMLNKYAREIYGVENKDALGRNILQVFPQIKDAEMYKDLKDSLQGKLIHNPYYKSRISDRILENFYVPLLDKDQQVYSVLVIGHDITDIIAANEKLKLVNSELEKSNRDLEQFAFVASHDLQEPLRKIQIFSHMAANVLSDKEATMRYLVKIISSAERMTNLIKAVLNYSRISNERGEFEKVDINEIIENIKNDFELTIAEKEATIEAAMLPPIKGNRLQLNQLFSNLISNSLKFSNEKPAIIISTDHFAKTQAEADGYERLNGKYIELSVQDNGIGFDEKYADKVFTVFQRLHPKQDYPGTGIGLAICKKIVDNHRGNIVVKSKPGIGTTFEISLPAWED